jgi:hypothetical protein
MRETIGPTAGVLLTLAGFAAFAAFRTAPFLWLPFFALFLLSLLPQQAAAGLGGSRSSFLPFAAGLLAWPLRLFYWDRGDFSLRLRNRLLLAALFSLWSLLKRRRAWPRFLFFFNSLSLKKRLLAIFIAAELLFIAAAALLTLRGVALVGDEPHYLAISQSLARDHDLNVFNQYFRDGYKEFLKVEKLAAHGTWGRGYKRIFSYHLPGVSLTLTPFFFLRLSPPLLYFLARAWLGLFGALLAVLAYLFLLRLWRSRSLAFHFTLAFTLSAPVFFYSIHVFPEVQALLLVLAALYLLLYRAPTDGRWALLAGLLLGSTIFWGVKYAIFIYPFTLGFAAYWLWRRRFQHALLLLVFPVFFQALFFFYLYSAYGTFSPNAVYYGMQTPAQSRALVATLLKEITLRSRWETLLDYFFDQRDGLLLYNPLYFFAFPGLLLALKRFTHYRLHLLLSLPAGLFVLNHAFSTIRPGYCPQGRYLAPVVWALLLFALVYYREGRNRFFRRAILAVPVYSLFVTAYQVLEPATLYQPTTHDSLVRQGLLFQQWSSGPLRLPAILPSFIKIDNRGYLPNMVFLGIFLLLIALALLPWRRRTRLPAAPLLFVAIFALACLFPRPGLTAGRELPGPRGLPCQVYFQPRPESGGENATWDLPGRRCRMLIETLLPLKEIELAVGNNSATSPLLLRVDLFDAAAARLPLATGAIGRIRMPQPAFKKINTRYYYQFTMNASAIQGGPAPGWTLRLGLR